MKFVKLLIISILVINALALRTSNLLPFFNSFNNPKTRSTKVRTDSNGSISSLSNHVIKCMKSEGLQGFKLNEPSKGKINYNFTCQKSQAILDNEIKEGNTKWIEINSDLRNSTPLLANQEVKCDEGYGIQKFQIQFASKSIRYYFVCVRVQTLDCHAGASQESLAVINDDPFARVNSLKEQEVKLSSNQILTSFMLNLVQKNIKTNSK